MKKTAAAINRLQKAINNLEGWCRKWRIKLNGAKSNLLIIHRLHNQADSDCSIQLFDDIIRPCQTAKYLGVQFDRKLSFKEHFKEQEKKAVSRLNLFKLLMKNGVDKNIMTRLYKTYVRPIFEYGSVSFLPARIMQLQKIQNEFIRVCLKIPAYIRSDLLHEAAGLPLLKDRITSLNLKLINSMLRLDDIRKSVEKSLSVIPLNNYKSPVDILIEHL